MNNFIIVIIFLVYIIYINHRNEIPVPVIEKKVFLISDGEFFYDDQDQNLNNSCLNIYNKEINFEDRVNIIQYKNGINNKVPLVILFHGGGETPEQILNYSNFSKYDCVTLAVKGQVSNNRHSWKPAFPWMKKDPKDDNNYVDKLLDYIFDDKNNFVDLNNKVDKNRIIVAGKSDGGGMAFQYIPNSKSNIIQNAKNKLVAMVSSAHFSIGEDNPEFDELLEYYKKNKIFMIFLHGEGDTVIPIKGGKFHSEYAEYMAKNKGSSWTDFENTYTINFGILENNLKIESLDTNNKVSVYKDNQIMYVKGPNNHTWPGHENSGPQSDKNENKIYDATFLIASRMTILTNQEFFDDKLMKYPGISNWEEMKKIISFNQTLRSLKCQNYIYYDYPFFRCKKNDQIQFLDLKLNIILKVDLKDYIFGVNVIDFDMDLDDNIVLEGFYPDTLTEYQENGIISYYQSEGNNNVKKQLSTVFLNDIDQCVGVGYIYNNRIKINYQIENEELINILGKSNIETSSLINDIKTSSLMRRYAKK